jgi:alpha-L-arabinofuranosidase
MMKDIGMRVSPNLAWFLPLAAVAATVTVVSPPALLAAAPTATLTIHADRPGPTISPVLYGIFFEEINHAGDGGLYAELIRNRSFEAGNSPEPWSLMVEGQAKGDIALALDAPACGLNRRSLRLSIATYGQGAWGRVGVSNPGYFGIAVRKDAVYQLSLYAKAGDGFSGPVSASLEDAAGKQVYAQGRTEPLTGEWKAYHLSLTARATDPKARFVIAASRGGTIWLDMVSLFPTKTWRGRSNGLRPDLAQMLAALKPSFVRFPGGCWVEGERLQFAQRWKTTIGDPLGRRTQWNLWKYHSTNGLGFHEYLQLCEDLGAEPLFVINCGMSHKENVPLKEMSAWVQDALDAIEYSNGPVTSRWGALRAKAGHPEPFHLRYLEIGNENGGPAYHERYALFYDAIKAKYPDMHLIADVWQGTPKSRPCEILDEHYYSNPQFFQENADRYDGYDRKGPKIYVGEYAVTEKPGRNNLAGALGEAAFMTGMERNSDVVVMASYAPLFANVKDRRWDPDLINFDGWRVYGTPSYYVQQMFSNHRGDVVLPATIAEALAAKQGLSRHAVGLGTWRTQAEFKDVQVMQGQKVLLADDFARVLDGWKASSGQWKVADAAVRQTSESEDCRIVAGEKLPDRYVYRLKARKLGGNEGFLIMFHVEASDNFMWWNVGGWDNSKHALEHCTASGKHILGREVPGSVETNRWYDIRVEVTGERIHCYLDEKLIHDVRRPRLKSLFAVASRAEQSGEIILKVVNAAGNSRDTLVNLNGVRDVEPSGRAIVLTSPSPADENSLAEPTKVSPREQRIDHVAASFQHTFPANSVTILRVKTGHEARAEERSSQ